MQAAVSLLHAHSAPASFFSIKNQPKGAALRFALQTSLLQLFPNPRRGTATGASCRAWATEGASPVHNSQCFSRAFQCTENPSAVHLRVIQLVCFHFILFAKEVVGTFLLIYFYLMPYLQKAKTKQTQQNEKEERSHSHGHKTVPNRAQSAPSSARSLAEHPCSVLAAPQPLGRMSQAESLHLPSHQDLPAHCCMCRMCASCLPPHTQKEMLKDLGQPRPHCLGSSLPSRQHQHLHTAVRRKM